MISAAAAPGPSPSTRSSTWNDGAGPAIGDVWYNNRLIVAAAAAKGLAAPPLAVCGELLKETYALGHEQSELAAVIHAMTARNAPSGDGHVIAGASH